MAPIKRHEPENRENSIFQPDPIDMAKTDTKREEEKGKRGEIGMLWKGEKTVENSHFIYCFKNFSLKKKESEGGKKKKKKY